MGRQQPSQQSGYTPQRRAYKPQPPGTRPSTATSSEYRPNAYAPSSATASDSSAEKKKSKLPIILTAIGVVVLLAAIGGGVAMFLNDKEDTTATPADSTIAASPNNNIANNTTISVASVPRFSYSTFDPCRFKDPEIRATGIPAVPNKTVIQQSGPTDLRPTSIDSGCTYLSNDKLWKLEITKMSDNGQPASFGWVMGQRGNSIVPELFFTPSSSTVYSNPAYEQEVLYQSDYHGVKAQSTACTLYVVPGVSYSLTDNHGESSQISSSLCTMLKRFVQARVYQP